jgi:CDP-glucose 4,6-dehydratase
VEGVVVDPRFWDGRRVLVTGHTGFKGSWLTLWLASMGAHVTGLSSGPPSSPSLFELARVGEDAESLQADVRDAGAVRDAVRSARPQVLLHLAAQSLVRASYEDPVRTYQVNVMGTAAVLDAARDTGVESVVVVTSDKCYLNAELGRAFVEDDPLGGRDPYSSSKAAQEIVAAAFRDSYGLPIASARAGNVIGGGDFGVDRLVPDAMRSVAEGAPLRVRNPDAVRPWQHVLNPLHGYLLLAEHGERGAWNFGPAGDDVRPVRWVVERLGVRWETDDGEHPHEARHLALDSTRAQDRLGWRPRWDLARGLDATAEWYAAHRDGADVREVVLRQIAEYSAS